MATAHQLDEGDLYCVNCGASVLGEVIQVCPDRRFRYDETSGLWHEQRLAGEFYFRCVACGARLDEDVADYLFDFLVGEDG